MAYDTFFFITQLTTLTSNFDFWRQGSLTLINAFKGSLVEFQSSKEFIVGLETGIVWFCPTIFNPLFSSLSTALHKAKILHTSFLHILTSDSNDNFLNEVNKKPKFTA